MSNWKSEAELKAEYANRQVEKKAEKFAKDNKAYIKKAITRIDFNGKQIRFNTGNTTHFMTEKDFFNRDKLFEQVSPRAYKQMQADKNKMRGQ